MDWIGLDFLLADSIGYGVSTALRTVYRIIRSPLVSVLGIVDLSL